MNTGAKRSVPNDTSDCQWDLLIGDVFFCMDLVPID